MEDRRQRCALGGLGRVLRVEVHNRLGIRNYGMAWEHLLSYLMLARERVYMLALKEQQKVFREMLAQQSRTGKSMVLQKLMVRRTGPFVLRKEIKQRYKPQERMVLEEQAGNRHDRQFWCMKFWHLECSELFCRNEVIQCRI